MVVEGNLKDELNNRKESILKIAHRILKANDSNIYQFDLFCYGIVKRSLALIRGFSESINNNNFICAAPLIRMHLDNLLRLYASSITPDVNEFAIKVIGGTHVRNIEDRNGKKMTDYYLKTQLSKEYNWITSLYDETSGYVHLSNKHIFNSFNNRESDKKGLFKIELSDNDDNFISEELIKESFNAMLTITDLINCYLESWASHKERK